MNFLLRLFMCCLCIGLTHCTIQQHTEVPVQNKQICLSQCMQKFNACTHKCTNNCQTCASLANNTSIIEYAEYVNERKVEGTINARNLKSYRDPLQCRKVTCNCDIDLTTCTQNCTGIIKKSLRPVPYCN